MNMLNSVILEGVVSDEPHLDETSDVLNFTIAIEVTSYYKNKAWKKVTETSRFRVVAFNSMCKRPLKNGSEVRLVGRLKQNKWTDKDGVPHSEVLIMAEYIEIKKKEFSNDKF